MVISVLVVTAVLLVFSVGFFIGYATRMSEEWNIIFTRLYGSEDRGIRQGKNNDHS